MSAPFPFSCPFLDTPSVEAMAQLANPVSWGRSTADAAFLETLVTDGVLPPNSDASRPVWITPTSVEREP